MRVLFPSLVVLYHAIEISRRSFDGDESSASLLVVAMDQVVFERCRRGRCSLASDESHASGVAVAVGELVMTR